MKISRIYKRSLGFIRINWFIVAFIFIAVISSFVFFRNTSPKAPKIKAASSDQFVFEAKNKIYSAQIGASKSPKPFLSFTSKAGGSAAFQMDGLSDASLSQKNNKVTYHNVNGNTDVTYSTLSNGIKEEIILNSSTPVAEYIFDVVSTNAKPKKTLENTYTRYFYDDEGRYQFHIEKPFAVDSSGQRTDDIKMQIRRSDDDENRYQILVSIPTEWLNSKDRSFPISIDPTIVYDTSAEFAAGSLDGVFNTGTANSPAMETYYQEQAVDSNTVALWHMDEASGNLVDSSPNGLTGTNTGSTATTGVVGNGRSFNGTSNYVSVPGSEKLDLQKFTIEAWLYSSNFDQDGFIFEKSLNGSVNTQYSCFFAASGNIYFRTYTFGGIANDLSVNTVASGIKDSAWNHLACAYSGTLKQIFVNGVLVASAPYSATLASKATGPSVIGAYGSGTGYFFSGIIDELRISSVARTPEEIRSSASRKPFGVYTSDVIDFGSGVASWNPLTWTELGVATGDGETPSSSTSLIAQWNLNSTSGTTATSDTGSCGATCNGTLVGFASTTSQDASTSSGWSTTNRKLGAGALMFDGVNDTFSVPTGSNVDFDYNQDFTVSTWLKIPAKQNNIATTQNHIIFKYNGAVTKYPYSIRVNNQTHSQPGRIVTFRWDSTNAPTITSSKPLNDDIWHNIVFAKTGSSLRLYVDGQLDGSVVDTTTTTTTNSSPIYFGSGYNSIYYFTGAIDATSIYSRGITPAEVVSNFQSGSLELQTRVGNSSNPDDGTWEAWKPVTGETSIDNLNNPLDVATPSATILSGTLIATSAATLPVIEGTKSLKIQTGRITSHTNTVGLWHLDETSGTGAYLKDSTANANHATPTGTSTGVGISDKGRVFNGTSDYLVVTDTTALKPNQITIESWFKTTTDAGYIVGKYTGSSPWPGYALAIGVGSIPRALGCWVGGSSWTESNLTVADNSWHHGACTYDGTTVSVYVDGVLAGSSPQTGNLSGATNLYIGSYITPSGYFKGSLDEVRVSNIARSAEEIAEVYRSGSDHYINKTISSTDLSGKTSIPFYIAADRPGSYLSTIVGESAYDNNLPDSNTVALWHLDDQSGYSPYHFENTIFTNKWTEFDPSATKIAINNILQLSAGTLAAWDSGVISKESYTRSAGLTLYAKVTTGASVAAPNHMMIGWGTNSTSVASYSNISHALYFNAGSFSIYQDNVAIIHNLGNYVANTTYEVKISINPANTATYSVKGGIYTDWTILYLADNAKVNTPLRLQVAQHRFIGSISELSAIYPSEITDSSGNSIHGTNGGTFSETGKIGPGKNFNGAGDFINIPDTNSLSFGNGVTDTPFTISTWIYPKSIAGTGAGNWIINKRNTGSEEYQLAIWQGQVTINLFKTAGIYISATSNNYLIPGNWYHVVTTYDGSSSQAGIKIYVNGAQQPVTASNVGGYSAMTGSNAPVTIGRTGWSNSLPFNGIIDEIRIDNVARTANQIRRSFDFGQRTHPITIDFNSAISHTNTLSSSADLSFNLLATPSGTTNAGDNIFTGDKIIVKENYNGTEYIAQGTVNGVNISTGATTVKSWDAGSTFPSVGFSPNATVFKWQREYWNITEPLDTDLDAVTNLTFRVTNGNEARNIWIDDLRSNSSYLTTPGGSTITSSTNNQYLQYRSIISSFGENQSATLSAVNVSYVANIPVAPSSLSGTALSTTSIRWDYTDNSSNETGFKLYDLAGTTLKATNSTANSTSITESSLTPNTTYDRRVVSYNGFGNSTLSPFSSATTLATVPASPTTSRSLSSAIVTLVSNTNPANTELAIYKDIGSTCDGSGGSYVSANGSDNGSTAIWQAQSAWGTNGVVTVTALNAETGYSFCVKARNSSNVETAFSSAGSSSGTLIPISGDLTVASSTNFLSRYKDGSNAARYIIGLDAVGAGNINSSKLNLNGGSVTVNSDETLAVGTIVLNGGSLFIATNGAKLAPGSRLWALDADADGFPDTSGGEVKLWISTNAPGAAYRRKALMGTLADVDCDPASFSNTNTCCVNHNYYIDADSDTYGSGSAVVFCQVTPSTPVGYSANNTDCDDTSSLRYTNRTCYLDSDSDGYRTAATASSCAGVDCTSSTTTYHLESNAPVDCNDGNDTLFRTVSGYLDADSDTYGAGALTTCAGASGTYVATNTDCGPNASNAYPGSPTCSSTSFLNASSVASWDYDCSASGGAGTNCGTTYNYTTAVTNGSTSAANGNCKNFNMACGSGSVTYHVPAAIACGNPGGTCAAFTTNGANCSCVSSGCSAGNQSCSESGGSTVCDTITPGTQACK